MYIFSFEKLDVWKLSKEFVKEIYLITKQFPAEELYSLTSQLRRAGVSIASNIAEGAGRTSAKDQARFYGIAYASLMETLNQLIIAYDLSYIDENSYKALRNKLENISIKLNALKKSKMGKKIV